MNLKKIFKLYLTAAISIFAVACTVSSTDDNDKCPDYRISVMCYAYGPNDECGNPTCAPQDVEDSIFRVQDSIYYASIYEAIQESGKYTTKDSVAAYLCKFDKLPSNYVNKSEGQKLYESKTGKSFEKWNFNPWVTIGVMIGGDTYSNSEGLLPKGSYHEADVDYSAKNRGTKRLVYQSDCVIYYTSDHYKSYSEIKIH